MTGRSVNKSGAHVPVNYQQKVEHKVKKQRYLSHFKLSQVHLGKVQKQMFRL